MPPLKNNQHERFCLAIMSGKNQTEAAIEAGYKASRASSTGSNLVRNRKVSARLEELKQAAADARIMSVQERMERLSEIARARVTDFTACEQGVARINVELKAANSAAIQEIVTDEVQVGKGDSALIVQVTKLKLHNPMAAIAELNKMDGAYAPTKTEVTGKDGKPIQIEAKTDLTKLTDEELTTLESILGKTTNIPGSQGGEGPPASD